LDVADDVEVHAWVQGELAPWLAAGFVEQRRENRYVVPATATRGGDPPAGISFVTVDNVDADRLRELDDLLRQDVPGTDGWRWAPAEFRDEIAAADPALYLVAVDDASGEYVGIVRVWGTRLGFVGVRREFRGRGIASALVDRVFAVLAVREVDKVTTEIDVTNEASRATIEPLGARLVGESVEVVRHRIR